MTTESNLWILCACEEGRSQLNGGVFWRLTFLNADTGDQAEMTVDPAYRNFKRSGWNHVVSDPYPYGIYADLKLTRRHTQRGHAVVSADSPARVKYRCADDGELERLVQAVTQPEPTPFQELFHAA